MTDADVFPATFAQQRLFFIDSLDRGNPAYNVVAVSHRVPADLDVPRLERALGRLVDRHETLRTTLAAHGPAVEQHVRAEGALPLTVLDVEDLASSVVALAEQRLDIRSGPLAAATLLRRGQDRVLVVVLHHVIADGWSVGVLRRDLAAAYAQEALAPLEIGYGDFALWQRQTFADPLGAAELDWWRGHLADPPARLDLPVCDARPPAATFRGDRIVHVLPEGLTSEIGRLARRHHGTPYMVLLAAYLILLHRVSGREDLVVGTPVAARPDPVLEPLVGYFANTVLVRRPIRGEMTLGTVLAEVRESVLKSFAHADTPFERLVDALSPPRDPSANPLFQMLFALHNLPEAPLRLAGRECEPFPARKLTTRFDLALDITEERGVLTCVWEFATALLDRERATRLSRIWTTCLRALTEDPDRAVADIDLLDPADPDGSAELTAWETGPEGAPGLPPPAEMFDRIVRRHPERVAVTCGTTALTYGELALRADHYARLAENSTGPVGICLPRGVEAIAAMLGVWRAGRAFVPMEPAHPEARRADIARDAGVSLVISADGATAREGGGSLADVAYLIYTSGSTGRPKGVAVRPSSVANLVAGMRDTIGWDEGDVFSAVHSFAFDLSVWEIWAPLLTGARLVVATEAEQASVAGLRALVEREGVTVLSLTPSVLREHARLADPPGTTLRKVMAGGEALPGDLARAVARWPVELWNLYGPTEATVWASASRVGPDQAAHAVVPLGPPLPGTRILVLDDKLRRLPVGVPGELCIAGAGVAAGYHGRPDLTADSFVPDPWSATGGRLYRTGDRVVRRADGQLAFLGRADAQVKVRGHRIELGEVEAALRRQPGVADAAAAVHTRGDHRELVGYVVPGHAGVTGEALRAAIRSRLPDYLTPGVVVVVDALPRNANGKLDRRALPLPRSTPAPEARPRDDLELEIAACWSRILDTQVGIYDNFFDLGGHSLLAMHAATELGISPALLLQAPTVAGLAEALRGRAPEPDAGTVGELFAELESDAELGLLGEAAP